MKMNKLLLGTIILCLLLYSCQNGPTQKEYDNLKAQLENCSKENKELKNTPEHRLLTAQKFVIEGRLNAAESEFKELIKKYPKTDEAQVAQSYIHKVEKEREQKRLE